MCGIAGVVLLDRQEPVGEQEIGRMLGTIRHRGPDEFGIYLDRGVGLGSARLSIIDLQTGQQPIGNEDGTKWVVFNGEIFNYLELRPELEARGHRFETNSDTEVLLHAYEEWGPACVERFNGQFAFAIWDTQEQSLFLARDRLGVRPLFYSVQNATLIFGSEIKAILASGRVSARIDPAILAQVFTYWSPLPPRTAFVDVLELPPGHYLLVKDGLLGVQAYWQPRFPEVDGESPGLSHYLKGVEDCAEELTDLLVDATRLRLRADVPVGAYLSGGLDSSVIASIIRKFTSTRLDTFSIAFDDANFDESAFQNQMARFLGTDHQVVHATYSDIGKAFPDVIWHTEVPIVRTAPVPMFMLSRLVRDSGYKVVLTGEGADEFLAGYDFFKVAKIRHFGAIQPHSKRRPTLLRRLYPDIPNLARNNPAFLAAFFGEGLTQVESPEYSHALRWRNGRRNCRFLNDALARSDNFAQVLERLLHPKFGSWSPLARAQYLEIKIFLSEYLLSSQGDRVAMAHSIEGRFPFLDCRVVDFCNGLPARFKMRALTEKYLLKVVGKTLLPDIIWQRPKRPYRAPIHRCFFGASTPDYVKELLSPQELSATGFFRPQAVTQLVKKLKSENRVSESDDMALAGILSTQLLHHQFVERPRLNSGLVPTDKVKVCRASGNSCLTDSLLAALASVR